jgi:predicted ester cyclase
MILHLMIAAATVAAAPQGARATADRFFAAFDAHDVAAIAKLYPPDAVLTSSDFCGARTGADVIRTYAALFKTFPDIKDQVEQMVVDGDSIAIRFTAVSGGFSLKLMAMLRVKDGMIVEDRTVFDNGGRPCEP